SRKTFLKGGGGLLVGFSIAGALATEAAASVPPLSAGSAYSSNGPFDQNQVDSSIVINPDNTAQIMTGAQFRGTGSETWLLMIAAEELRMDLDQRIFISSDTSRTPDTGSHGASNTITHAGTAIRTAAAYAHQALMSLASTQLNVPVAQL